MTAMHAELRLLLIDPDGMGEVDPALRAVGVAPICVAVRDQAAAQMALGYGHFDAVVLVDGRDEPVMPTWVLGCFPLRVPLLMVVRPQAERAALAWCSKGVDEVFALDRLYRLPGWLARRQQAGSQDEFMAQVSDNWPGVLMWYQVFPDGRQRMPFVSPASIELFGFRPEEVREDCSAVMARVHPDDTERLYGQIAEAMTTLKAARYEFRFHNPDRGWQWVENYSLPKAQPDGSVIWYGFVQDVTERKVVETELRNHREHLQALVEQRTMQLREAQAKAEAANLAKSAFLANMSHEIRTPMNAILGLTHLLQRGEVNPLQAERLDKIETAGRHLLSILNDVLDLSKIEAGKLELDQADFHLSAVMDHVASLIGDSARAKGLQLEMDLDSVPAWLKGDATRLRQALLNFASNAVKFTSEGAVCLRTCLLKEEQDRLLVRFEVEDSGVGLNEAQQMRLFQAFEQADTSTTRQFGGTGLGLAITKRLATLMGGEVGVRSQLGRGSTFWFTAWLQRGRGVLPTGMRVQSSEAETELRHRFGGLRILLAEDNDINREVALELLYAVRMNVDSAPDGQKAVALARQHAYDLVLLDMQMPELDGLQAAQAIRQLPQHAHTPILAMTANAFLEDRVACLAVGMNDHISKPVDPPTLYAKLLLALAAAQADQRAGRQEVEASPVVDVVQHRFHRLEAIDELDVQRGLSLAAYKPELYLRLLPMFLERHAGDAEAMRRCLAQGDVQGVWQLVHALKSVGGNIGATRVCAATEALEWAVRTGGDEALLPALIDEVAKALDALVVALTQALAP